MARLNFTDVPEQKNFEVLPTGQYVAQISNLSTRLVGDSSPNAGALTLRWEFEILNDEYSGRKVFDNQTCVASSLWKVKALLNALDLDTSTLTYDDEEQTFYFEGQNGEEQLDLDELVGSTIELKVGVRPARKDPNTGQDYDKQNRVNAFFPHEASDAELMA